MSPSPGSKVLERTPSSTAPSIVSLSMSPEYHTRQAPTRSSQADLGPVDPVVDALAWVVRFPWLPVGIVDDRVGG
jgi:hypothetical protein